jgi:maleate isomerase
MGSDACDAAFAALGMKTIAVVTPYQPVGDQNVLRFFQEAGYEVKRIKGLKCESPVKIAHVTEGELRAALQELDGDDIDGIVQVGTNLAMARLAAQAEVWLDKPVLAINTAIYWHALRESGISDRLDGFGSLMLRH